MQFQVFKGPTTYMSTTSLIAIPFDNLPSMQRAGYRFRLDGKAVTMSKVMELKSAADAELKARAATSNNLDDDVSGETNEDDIRKEQVDRPDLETKPTTLVHINPVPVPADKPTPTPINPPVNPPAAVKKGRSTKKVYCKETDTVYDSMSAAGRALNLDPAAVSYAAANGRTTKGYTFSVVTD